MNEPRKPFTDTIEAGPEFLSALSGLLEAQARWHAHKYELDAIPTKNAGPYEVACGEWESTGMQVAQEAVRYYLEELRLLYGRMRRGGCDTIHFTSATAEWEPGGGIRQEKAESEARRARFAHLMS